MSSDPPRDCLPWPLWGLRVRTPRVELRYLDDELLPAVLRAADDVFGEGPSQFSVDWTSVPLPRRHWDHLRWVWRCRAETGPESWTLSMAVLVAGEVVGVQDLRAEHFAELRSVSTGSWLARRVQGRGIGTEMRRAALHLAFDGLGALEAHSEAFSANAASQGVSRALGYEPNGVARALRGGTPDLAVRFRMDAAGFARIRRADVVVEGLGDEARELLGASPLRTDMSIS
jgi:RimJ/RimL family protein N-acetyltransferase